MPRLASRLIVALVLLTAGASDTWAQSTDAAPEAAAVSASPDAAATDGVQPVMDQPAPALEGQDPVTGVAVDEEAANAGTLNEQPASPSDSSELWIAVRWARRFYLLIGLLFGSLIVWSGRFFLFMFNVLDRLSVNDRATALANRIDAVRARNSN